MTTGFLWFVGVCLVGAGITARKYPLIAGAFFACIILAVLWWPR